jgi:DNA end-binding protein Ku
VAIGKVVFTSREHIIALEAWGPDEKVPKDMLELATHIVDNKKAHFEPQKFEDQYEDAFKGAAEEEAVRREDQAPRERAPAKVINLMDALRRSVETAAGNDESQRDVQAPIERRRRPDGRARDS